MNLFELNKAVRAAMEAVTDAYWQLQYAISEEEDKDK